jgi:predicted AlkP superfamily phosphohydrolase/phosphomutase
MAKKPKKVAVIGLDCALPHLIEKHIAEGHLPTFKYLFEKGVIADNGLAPFPTVTPPNWATIATGAWAGTHGITDFHVHEPGTDLDSKNAQAAFSSERCEAEYIWDAADKAGKKCIVVNYPGAWPSNMKNGIMVGGAGLSVGEDRDGHWGLNSEQMLCADQLITTGIYPLAVRAKFEDAEDWKNLAEPGEDPLEMEFQLAFPRAKVQAADTSWYILAQDLSGNGYDQITLSSSKDMKDAFCTLKIGEWSEKITAQIKMADGTEQEVFFHCKLIELSDDADDFRLYISNFCQTSGWSSPPDIAGQVLTNSEKGFFGPGGGVRGLAVGWFDLETYVEINQYHDQFLGDAVTTLLGNNEWDLFYMHSHPPDWMYHVIISEMDEQTCTNEDLRQMAWDTHLKIYQSQDRMLERMLEVMGKDTLVILVSDHGATPDGTLFNPHLPLVEAGLTKMIERDDELVGFEKKILEKAGFNVAADPKTSKAIPQREIYIYINLKGRDPDGIVDPEDYETVQQEIIDALLSYKNPETGKRPIALALTKNDARILGLYGDKIGDVVYAVNPWFGSQHGQILPTGKWGVGDLKALLTFTGPGIKKGHRLQRNAWLTDIVPTVCYLLDLPVPEHAEGAVLYQVFKDPNFKLKDIQKLKDGIERMETALARESREPWDKHDCA